MQSNTDRQPGSEEQAKDGMFASPDQAVRVLRKVIIGLGVAIAVVMVVMGVLIYHRLSDDKAEAPQAPVAETEAATGAPAPRETPQPVGRTGGKPGAIEGERLVTSPRGEAADVRRGVITLGPGERVVRFQVAGPEFVLLVENEAGGQELVSVDRETGAVRARLAVRAGTPKQ